MKVLPRYTFRGTSQGACTVCGDPDCLCDVKIVCPIAIRRDVKHRYWQYALDELDDYEVTDRNFVEASSIVLGMFELERALSDMRPSNGGPQAWQDLPEGVLQNLRYHYRAGTPWRWAQLELEGVDYDERVVSKYYLERRRTASMQRDSSKYAALKRARRQAVKKPAPDYGMVACQSCGKVVANVQNKRSTCSNRCRVALQRARANGSVQRVRMGADND